MELNQEWVSKAQDAFDHSSSNHEGIAAAIETYLTEMFKPGSVQMLEPLEASPQRDYRKELWLGVATAVARSEGARDRVAPGEWADRALADFDATFPPEPTHG